jgi:sporulation protein YlmC with PRC-barrel domain
MRGIVRELDGRIVIAVGAKQVGTVSGIEIEPTSWEITHLRVELTEQSVSTFGYNRPLVGKVEALIPTSAVQTVGDIIVLDKTVEELKEIIGKKGF